MTENLVTKTRQFLQGLSTNILEKRLLIAISGGIDSVVMAHVLHQLGIKAALAHCNFGLRGQASDDDEAFVRALGTALGYEVHTTKFQTKEYAKVHGISTQMAARELRYSWFHELLQTNQYDYIAIAQHTNDNIETILLNLTRGTGIAGVRGILPLKDVLIRPLLFSNREEINDFALSNEITWREDASNESDDYARNKLRHHVVPILKQINPSLETTFQDTAERLLAAEQLISSVLQKAKKTILQQRNEGHIIIIPDLLKSEHPLFILADILQEFGFNYQQAKEVYKALTLQSGKEFLSLTHVLLKDRDQLIITPRIETLPTEVVIDLTTQEISFANRSYQISKQSAQKVYSFSSDIAYLDFDTLTFPLKLRSWKVADKLSPLGMKGKMKKVSDIFIDAKLSKFEKEKVGILVNGDGEIIWVAGFRLSEKFALTSKTTHLVKVSLQKNE